MPLDGVLHKAARDADVAACELALSNGCDIDALGAQGRTALHRALGSGSTETCTWLLEKGANVQIVDAMQRSSLHYAVMVRL